MSTLNWSLVIDRLNQKLEFGACHVRYAWRRHTSPAVKFDSLEGALVTSQHALPKLLQEVGGNVNALKNPARGEALFAAVWYPDSEWAILCDATRATLVPRTEVERFEVCKERRDELIEEIRALFDRSPAALRRPLSADLYATCVVRATAGRA